MRVREADERDAEAMAHAFVTSYRQAHRDHLPDGYLLALSHEESARNWARTLREIGAGATVGECVFVAEDATGELVGVAMGGPAQANPSFAGDDAGTVGEVYALYVLATHQRRGIGRRLLAAVAQRLAEQGLRALQIRCLRVNEPARRFYERLGGRLVGEDRREDDGVMLDQVVYGWPDLRDLLARVAGGAR